MDSSIKLDEYSFEDVESLVEKIDGWLTPDEAKTLYKTALNLDKKGAIVEIGSWCSKSLTYLSAGAIKANNNCKIFSIDPFLTSKNEPNGMYETFIANLKKHGLLDRITHIKEKSQVAGETFNEKVELLFIDGFHQYDAVKKDFELFYPQIVNHGFVLLHDVVCYKGPTMLVKELTTTNDSFKILDFKDTIILAQKVETLTDNDKKNNAKIIELIEEKIELNGFVD